MGFNSSFKGLKWNLGIWAVKMWTGIIWLWRCGLELSGCEDVDWNYLAGKMWTGIIWLWRCGLELSGCEDVDWNYLAVKMWTGIIWLWRCGLKLSGWGRGSRTVWFVLLKKSGEINTASFVKRGEIHDEVSNLLVSQGQCLNLLFNGLWEIFSFGWRTSPNSSPEEGNGSNYRKAVVI